EGLENNRTLGKVNPNLEFRDVSAVPDLDLAPGGLVHRGRDRVVDRELWRRPALPGAERTHAPFDRLVSDEHPAVVGSRLRRPGMDVAREAVGMPGEGSESRDVGRVAGGR